MLRRIPATVGFGPRKWANKEKVDAQRIQALHMASEDGRLIDKASLEYCRNSHRSKRANGVAPTDELTDCPNHLVVLEPNPVEFHFLGTI